MNRLLALTVFLLGVATPAVAAHGPAPRDTVVLRVGDTLTVEDAPIGCQVVERKGRPSVDCRRAGQLAGTYMTAFDARRARVARFRSDDTARVVFTARHRGAARRCDHGGEVGRGR